MLVNENFVDGRVVMILE